MTRALFSRPLIALTTALAIAVAGGAWLQSRAMRGQAQRLAERSAIVRLGALADVVERTGLDSEELQQLVADWVERDAATAVARVVRFQGIRLMASTATADRGDEAAPRKMKREEKAFYDLGQSLRAAVETNVQEQRAFKEEIDVQPLPDGGLALASPVEEGGRVVGAVLLEAAPRARAAGVGALSALAAIALPLVVFLALTRLLAERRLAALVLAAVLVAAAVVVHGNAGLDDVAAGRLAMEQEIAELIDAQAEIAAAVTGGGDGWQPTAWDQDRFRRPLGFQQATGPVAAAVEASLAEDRASYWKLMLLFFALALLALTWIGLGGARRTGETLVRHRLPYFYVLPAMAGMTLLVFFPFSYGILLSFTNSNIYNTDKPLTEIWSGFENYTDIVTDVALVKDTAEGRVFDYQNFYWTLGFTIIWTITNVAIGVSVGLLLALILNRKGFVLKPIYRVLLILPWAVPNYITALIWKGMFHSQFGVINQVVQIFGGEAVSWFDTPFKAFITVLSTNGWLSFPFMMVISLGALQSIPADLYEAARVDGAGRWAQFRTITLPSLKPALVPAIIISVVWTFNQFNVIYLVASGEPAHSTEILITEAYKIAFEQYRYGYAAAYSVLIFAILLAYGVWQSKVTKATEGI